MLGKISIPGTVIAIRGNDRVKFLHNFCTADIRRMDQGSVCEAMILDGKGKLVSFVHVFSFDDRLELIAAPDQATLIISHLDRYIIREDVRLEDISPRVKLQLLFPVGETCGAAIENSLLPFNATEIEIDRWLGISLDGVEFVVGHADFRGESLLLAGPCLPELPSIKPADPVELERYRISRRFPLFGVDFDSTYLPQELRRDSTAISFDKGCYLGQETVARIDAMGHVNRFVCLIGDDSNRGLPPAGTKLIVDEKDVGTVSSTVQLPDGSSVGMATIKRMFAKSGTRISVSDRQIVVIE